MSDCCRDIVIIFAVMAQFYHDDFKVGILGGGQLGRMLIQTGIDLDIQIAVLDPDANAPCSGIAHEFVHGSITDFDSVYQFGKDKDLITIEIENVNVDALDKLVEEGVTIYPQPNIIRLIQDKGLQKEFYQKNNIPTAPFQLIKNNNDLLAGEIRPPFVQKLRKGGYDGKGVQVIKDKEQLNSLFTEPSVIEELVDFEKELSVIVSRNAKGEICSYPVVEMEFNPEANLVEFLFSPAEIHADIASKAKKIAEKVITDLNMVGILAVELFLTKSGDILVNEIAPRPHNSGHQTIEGNICSQYEQHLRSILNLPLGSTEMTVPSVMVNLLGEKDFNGRVVYQGIEEAMKLPGVYVHVYGKRTTKPFRKMGHVTVINPSLSEAKSIARKVNELLKVVSE